MEKGRIGLYTLLIVDDEEIEREGMAQFIPWDTYEMKVVGTARNGAEGLKKIAKYKPDLAIVDIKMPVMNGIEMIRKAKEQYPDMTFVVLSGYGDYECTSQAMELGVRHYILKPFWTSGSSAGSTHWSGMWWAICWETFCRTAPC